MDKQARRKLCLIHVATGTAAGFPTALLQVHELHAHAADVRFDERSYARRASHASSHKASLSAGHPPLDLGKHGGRTTTAPEARRGVVAP